MSKLIIENGIVQNDTLAGIPVLRRIIVPQGSRANVRTGMALQGPIGITNHNTGNPAPTADAKAHATWLQRMEAEDQLWIGAHFFVDSTCIVQTLPLNEVSWHAGDGDGPGNRQTISIEICETEPYAKAETHAITLNAALLHAYPGTKLYKHQDWSGKYCPRKILDRNGWAAFTDAIRQKAKQLTAQAAETPHRTDNIPDDWAKYAVAWAQQKKLLVGDHKGDLALHRPVTRQELTAILQRFHGM